MADDTTQQDATSITETADAETAEVVNEWEDKFKGQQKVNRDLERKLRETQAEVEKTRLASLSDAEKAVELARAETRQETLRIVGGRLVDAEVRAAAAGRLATEQIDALLEGLDRSRFITDDGDVDRDALASWVGRFAPAPPSGPQRPRGDVDQGVRTTATKASSADLFAAAIEGSFTR